MKVSLEHVTKRYGEQTVLRDVNLTFEEGSASALTGASGIGKTTLLRLILGLETPDEGRVRWLSDPQKGEDSVLSPGGETASRPDVRYSSTEEDGRKWKNIVEKSLFGRRRPLHAGCVFQEDRLAEDSSAVRNLTAAVSCSEAEIRAALGELLPPDALDKPVRELSGGMKRRVCLARACLSSAGILILDEPFTGLDPETRKQAIRFLQEKRRGRTLILAVHSLEGLEFCREIPLR